MKQSIRNKIWICSAIVVLLLVADQVIKIWVKTHFTIGGGVNLIGDWCRIYFIENKGMAFGMAFGGDIGKLFLTLFRLVASILMVYILVKQIRKDARYTLVVSIALILVGAVGNLVDSCFYGLIFSESSYTEVATLFPEGGGYGRFLHGRVVDMFFFPLFEWTWPSWVPVVGGRHAEFFNAVFNLADAAITIGVGLLLVDQVFLQKNDAEASEEVENDENEEAESVEKEVATAEAAE
ncbi:MAG: lipoprotein signal peptidase [Bacteroidales bacterium]|nr:lipoprotein signal peptidase [Bacteroidales bacterium]